MLQLLGLIKQTRLPYHVFSKSALIGQFRFLSDKRDKPPDGDKCKKSVCKDKIEKKPDRKKDEPKKDENKIRDVSKCQSKEKSSSRENPNKPNCIERILQREGAKKKKKSTTQASGSGPKCKPGPKPEPSYKHSKRWQKISMMGVLPLVALLTLFVFTSHHDQERPEFKPYPYMYQRTKPFFWGDGNRGRFHNSYWNAIPPDGYEDEIDAEGVGKTPETDKEREVRLKEFADKQKEWKKVADKRNAEAKKAEAEAEKEAKRQQAEAEKEAKKQQAEAEKEAKKQQAEAEKEEKKAKAAAEKERKRQEEEEKKELKRQEAEEKKRLQEEAKKVEHSVLTSE